MPTYKIMKRLKCAKTTAPAIFLLPLIITMIISFPAFAVEPTPGTDTSLLGNSENFTFGGWIEGLGAWDTENDSPTEQSYLFRNRVRLESDWRHRFDLNNRLKVRISLDSDYLKMGGGDKSYNDYNFTLHEGYLLFSHCNITTTIGRQIVRWGKTDQLSPVDNLNPQDLRLFILPELEERKIPIWMLRVQGFGNNWSWEGIYIPWFANSDIDYFDSDWAIFRHLREDINRSALPPEYKIYADKTMHVKRDKPAHTLGNGEFGGRVSFTLGRVDFSLSYLYGWENQPTIESFPIKNLEVDGSFSGDDLDLIPTIPDLIFTDENIRATYKRQQVTGFEFETTIGNFGLRGEAAHFDRMAFLTSDLTSKRHPVFHTVVGIDYSGTDDWYCNLQASYLKIMNYNSEILYFKDENIALMGKISKHFFNHNLELGLRYNYTITDKSYYLEPKLTLKYFTDLNLELGANFLGGDKDTLFGSFRNNDQLFVRIKYYF